jgi:hypothetical protein
MKRNLTALFKTVALLVLAGVNTAASAYVFKSYIPGVKPTASSSTPLAAIAGVSPASLNFGGVLPGATSATQSVTLANTGNAPLTISGATASAPFAETTTCGSSLAAGTSCAYAVDFAPTSFGAATGTLQIVTSVGTQSVSLTGTGQGTSLAANPTSLNFGNIAVGGTGSQSFTLSNTGNQNTSSLTITPPAGVSESDNCSGKLAAGSSCVATVTWTPSSATSLSGTLTAASQDSTASVTLSGSSTAVSQLYVASSGTNTIQLCQITTQGTSSGCSTAATITDVYGMTTSGSYLYAASYSNNSIYSCLMNSNGSLSNCTVQATGLNGPYEVVVNNGYLYVSDWLTTSGQGITVCKMGSNGTLSGCQLTGPTTADNAMGITFSGNVASIMNSGTTNVLSCTVNSDGTLSSNCTTTNIGISPRTVATSGQIAYVSTTAALYSCPYSGGSWSANCTARVTGMSLPDQINIVNGLLYVAQFGTTSVSVYQMNGSGGLTSLGSISGFTGPFGIASAP